MTRTGRASLHVSSSEVEGERGGDLELSPSLVSVLDSLGSSLPFPSRRLGRAPMRFGAHSEPLPSRSLSHTIGSSFFVNPQPLI